MVGFAHRPPQGVSVAAIDDAGIAFGSFCSAGVVTKRSDDGAPIGSSGVRVCDACLLWTAPGLGAVAEVVLPVPVGRVVERRRARDERVPASVVPEVRARGPPIAV